MKKQTEPPVIVVGHYGSGKTEFAANYALKLREEGKTPVLVDLDIVNPYFRSRELADAFSEKGIRVISSNYEREFHLDMPALAAGIQSAFTGELSPAIIDVGGDPAGASALARYAGLLEGREYKMWMAVNANRLKTSTASEALEYIKEIEAASRLKVNGLLNTTHLLDETRVEDIRRGDQLCGELAEMTGLPVKYTSAMERLREEVDERGFFGELFFITPLIRPKWL